MILAIPVGEDKKSVCGFSNNDMNVPSLMVLHVLHIRMHIHDRALGTSLSLPIRV